TWLITSRTVHSVHGVELPRSPGFTLSTPSTVRSGTRPIVARTSMSHLQIVSACVLVEGDVETRRRTERHSRDVGRIGIRVEPELREPVENAVDRDLRL